MDTFRQHEVFEIEVLEMMRSGKAFDPLVFGGGTMLRLCHELPRYSVDLHFWFLKRTPEEEYLNKLEGLVKFFSTPQVGLREEGNPKSPPEGTPQA